MYILLVISAGLAFYSLLLALKAARQREIKSEYRWLLSLALIGIPIIGLVCYFLIRGNFIYKHHIYFSDSFVNNMRNYP